MDSLRFGRALGKGARAAARGVYEAVDAAIASNPNPRQPTSQPQTAAEPLRNAVQAVAQGAAVYGQQKQAVTREAGRLGKSLLAPFARAGRALWLEVTGTFFAIFALYFLSTLWRFHTDLRLTASNADTHKRLLIAVVASAVFVYFTISSFVRAHRLQSRRA
jgi:hypothetical protein